jgi:hypothetical protein
MYNKLPFKVVNWMLIHKLKTVREKRTCPNLYELPSDFVLFIQSKVVFGARFHIACICSIAMGHFVVNPHEWSPVLTRLAPHRPDGPKFNAAFKEFILTNTTSDKFIL